MSLPTHHPVVSGMTRLIPMVGHPVQQVHMPGVINARFRDRGIDAVMVPMDILPGALPHFAGLLRSAGIECAYRDTSTIESSLEGLMPAGPREILVAPADAEAARSLLAEAQS